MPAHRELMRKNINNLGRPVGRSVGVMEYRLNPRFDFLSFVQFLYGGNSTLANTPWQNASGIFKVIYC